MRPRALELFWPSRRVHGVRSVVSDGPRERPGGPVRSQPLRDPLAARAGSSSTNASTASEDPVSVTDEYLKNNETYVQNVPPVELPMPPGRHFAVLACMDARIDPAKACSASHEGDAHVIRNVWPRQPGRPAFADDLLEAARHPRIPVGPPHRLRHADLQEHPAPQAPAQEGNRRRPPLLSKLPRCSTRASASRSMLAASPLIPNHFRYAASSTRSRTGKLDEVS